MNSKSKIYLLSVCLYLHFIQEAISNWSLKKGTGQMIHQMIFLNNPNYNTLLTNPLLGENYSMKSSSYMFYGEYGLDSKTTIGASIIASRYDLTNNITNSTENNYAADSLELLVRRQIFSTNNTSLSTQFSIKIPGLYSKQANIYELNHRQNDYDGRIEFGVGMPDNNKQYFGYYEADNNFLLLSLGYKYREGMQFNELSQRVYYGHKISENYILFFKYERYNLIFNQGFVDNLSSTIASEYNTLDNFSFNNNALNRLSISIIGRINHLSSVEFGIIQDIYNGILTSTQSYHSNGIIIGYWRQF